MLVVYFTKGLRDVVLDELRELSPAAAIASAGERFVVADVSPADVATVERGLRTADDLRTLVAGPEPVASEAALAALAAAGAERALAVLEREGRDDAQPWSVTVSARRPVWKSKPAWSPAAAIAELGGADPDGTERRPVDLRLQVDGDLMHLALNRRPLAAGGAGVRRGALRPSVAAAMVRVAIAAADPAAVERGVYDPFTGSGTIALEAQRRGLRVFASDVDPEAVAITRSRLSGPALLHHVFEHDIRDGMPTRVDAGVIVGNLPWGTQIELERRTELFDRLGAIAAGVSSCAFLTTHHEAFIARVRRHVARERIAAIPLGLLGQRPAIVTVRP